MSMPSARGLKAAWSNPGPQERAARWAAHLELLEARRSRSDLAAKGIAPAWRTRKRIATGKPHWMPKD
jgi:hypothetical protein